MTATTDEAPQETETARPPTVEELILANEGLVVEFAQGFRNRGLDLDDLIGEGFVALVKAAQQFDPGLGFLFSTYAVDSIKRQIMRACRKNARPVRIPEHLHIEQGKIRRGTLDPKTMSSGRRERASHVAWLIDARSRTVNDWRLNQIPDHRRGITRESDGAIDAAELLATLPDRERLMVAAYYGLDGRGPRAHAAVGEEFGVSPDRARLIILSAIRRLREHLGLVAAAAPQSDGMPRRGIHLAPDGKFRVRINLGRGRKAHGGNHRTLAEARAAADALGERLFGIKNYSTTMGKRSGGRKKRRSA